MSGGLIPLAFDFETALIRSGCQAPPPACLTWQRLGEEAQICDALEARERMRGWLADPTILLIGANVAYDMGVAAEAWPELRVPIFAAYEADRVTDVQLRDRLLNIARGTYLGRWGKFGFVKHRYDLASIAKRVAGMDLQKDHWRLSYGEFIGVPLRDWPARAVEVQARARIVLAELEAHPDPSKDVLKRIEGLRSMVASDPSRCTEYPLDDARATLAVYLKQEEHAAFLEDQFRQAKYYWALHLGAAWGFRTDELGVEILRKETQVAHDEARVELIEVGLLRSDGTKDTKAAKRRMIDVCARDGLELRRTDGHTDSTGKCRLLDGTRLPDQDPACEEHICLDEDACQETEDEILQNYAQFGVLKKVLGTDVKAIANGVHLPIHTRYGLATSGRTTSSGKKE